MEDKNGKMTLDKLAIMVANGFSEINEKMATKDDLGNGLKKVEIRLGSVEDRLDRVEQKLGKVENRVEEVRDILVSEEKQVLDLQKRVGVLERAVK